MHCGCIMHILCGFRSYLSLHEVLVAVLVYIGHPRYEV